MEVLKASIAYLLSVVASRLLKHLTPIEFVNKPCEGTYKTQIDKGNVHYMIEVEQWCMCSKTSINLFNNCNKYYFANVDLMVENKLIGKRKDFFPAPIRGFFSKTKLPHAIIALAVINKAQKEASVFQEAA